MQQEQQNKGESPLDQPRADSLQPLKGAADSGQSPREIFQQIWDFSGHQTAEVLAIAERVGLSLALVAFLMSGFHGFSYMSGNSNSAISTTTISTTTHLMVALAAFGAGSILITMLALRRNHAKLISQAIALVCFVLALVIDLTPTVFEPSSGTFVGILGGVLIAYCCGFKLALCWLSVLTLARGMIYLVHPAAHDLGVTPVELVVLSSGLLISTWAMSVSFLVIGVALASVRMRITAEEERSLLENESILNTQSWLLNRIDQRLGQEIMALQDSVTDASFSSNAMRFKTINSALSTLNSWLGLNTEIAPTSASASEPLAAGQPFLGMTVLTIDDEPLMRLLNAKRLRTLGARVISAEQGAEGLLQLKLHPEIDWIMCDWDMPLMNGEAFMSTLAALGHALPVLFCSSRSEPASLVEMGLTEERYLGWLDKPMTADSLFGLSTHIVSALRKHDHPNQQDSVA